MTQQSIHQPPREGLRSAAVFMAIALAVAALGGLAVASSLDTWYADLRKPAFNPPDIAFAPLWTVLYVQMALSSWRVWRSGSADGRRHALILYAVQLGLNLAWPLIFFGLRRPDLALADAVILLAAVVAATAAFWRVDRAAGMMMLPYIAWSAFAVVLNFAIWRLN